jgi:NADPH:quinone reductase-like Zn-dependent oxidoreductase
MKASIYTKYGPPEVLQLKDVEKPAPKDNEVLIKIHATTVNRTDCGFRKPEYGFIVRLFSGLLRPKKNILGSEFAGEIEAIGKDVKTFQRGDPVFGLSTGHFGTHAEYVCIPEKGSITIKPTPMSYEEAAAVCDGLMLAMTYIRKINFQKSKNILINGHRFSAVKKQSFRSPKTVKKISYFSKKLSRPESIRPLSIDITPWNRLSRPPSMSKQGKRQEVLS